MKKWYLVLIGIVLIALALFFYIHSAKVSPRSKPVAASGGTKPLINLEPLLISKVKQLVKDGSHGLYNLALDSLHINLAQSSVELVNARLLPDTAALKKLDSLKKAPDDVFKISLHALHIENVNVKDFLFNKEVQLNEIHLDHPTVEVYHQLRTYNKARREDSATLYQSILKQVNRIAVKKINLEHGEFINHNITKNKTSKYNDFTMRFTDLLIDSATQYDKNRFLYSKDALLTFRNYLLRTPDSLYLFKIGAIAISGTSHSMKASNISLLPRYTKQGFQKRLKMMKDRYTLTIPTLLLNNINWWSLANEEGFIAREATILNGDLKIYLDRSLPQTPPKYQNFPQQILMKLPLSIDIAKLDIRNMNIQYEEHSPVSGKSGKIDINNLDGSIRNVTNMPEQIRRHPSTLINASARFLHQVPASATIKFNMLNAKKGDFSVTFKAGAADADLINTVAQPLGLFTINKGNVKSVKAHIAGNDYQATGNVLLLYDDLNITPLKKDDHKENGLKKKKLMGFIANTFVIKNSNPSKDGTPRTEDFFAKRDPTGSFFSLLWKATLVGILKTVGANPKIASKK